MKRTQKEPDEMPLVQVVNLVKHYQMGEVIVEALRGVNVSFDTGEYTAIMGPSGSGKSTFLNILGCLDTPTSGKYFLNNEDVSVLSDDELSYIRSTRIGFIFQSYNLITQLSVLENIEVPLFYQNLSEKRSREKAVRLAEMVGLGHRLHHHPAELSGGEQQRVAIARALVLDARLLVFDEPTTALTQKEIDTLLQTIVDLKERGIASIFVSHKLDEVFRIADIITVLRDGVKIGDFKPQELDEKKLSFYMTGREIQYKEFTLQE
ncbi:MAG: ABC transporter ATP-binding protein, partial [Candidatus Sumerlaeia bacterium]|nr:ABC transporter ATP-binding protein [Candidatus Sumerlaeia bacterium]